ncbi:MAG TPA: cellulase N-terminal Ig-like domain-containing protein, partial [Clostridia bacterium]
MKKGETKTEVIQPAETALTAGRDNIVPYININQAGYRTLDVKTAVFRDSGLDTSFDVINTKTGESVFTGNITGAVKTVSARETVAYGDFSDVTEPGTYKIKAANSGESYEFVIADDVYDGLFADAIKMFYL